jgi:hypothetical protein
VKKAYLEPHEMCEVVDLAKQEILNLRASNAELLAALKEIAANDPYKVSSAGVIARAVVAKVEGRKS